MTFKIEFFKRTIVFIATFLFLLPNTFQAQVDDPDGIEGAFSRSMVGQKAALIVVGPSVSEKTVLSFSQWGATLYDLLSAEYGYLTENIRLLYADGDRDKLLGDRVSGNADLETIETEIKALSKKLSPGDQVSIFLIGHGTGTGVEAKFNIVGPDITGSYFDE